MLKKKDVFLEKIGKKNYNEKLESIMEFKGFSSSAKSLLLSMLYKIEMSYNDCKTVKNCIESKDDYIENIIYMIEKNCNSIEVVKPHSKESKELGNGTFIIDKKNGIIKCYAIERKLLYAVSKISKKDRIVDTKYEIISKYLSELINVGDNINTVEPLRDFNGYSWTTITREIESLDHNIVYQVLRILVGYKLLKNWIDNTEKDIDYYDIFCKYLNKNYGNKNSNELIKIVNNLSLLLATKYNPQEKNKIKKYLKSVEEVLEQMQDKASFIEFVSKKKKQNNDKLKKLDKIINSEVLLKKELDRINNELPVQERKYNVKHFKEKMIRERKKQMASIEELNRLLIPTFFVNYKKELEEKIELLKLVYIEETEKEIQKNIVNLQKIFLKCFETKVNKAKDKDEVMELIYQFRYYYNLPVSSKVAINQIEVLKKQIEKIQKLLLIKARQTDLIARYTNVYDIDEYIFKMIFSLDIIKLEDICIKLSKENNLIYMQLFDGETIETKQEIGEINNISKKDIRLNKKLRYFNV